MADQQTFPRIASFKTPAAFRARLAELKLDLPCEDAIDPAIMSQPIDVDGFVVGNRWCVHPMEGWDGTRGGEPTEHTIRRWQHFGASGAKMIWGGEAIAVQPDGRANPNQLLPHENGLRALFSALGTDDLLVGLQLTHSGRFCRPNDKDKLEPKIAYHHPLLDRKFGISCDIVSDDYLERLIENYIHAAKIAQRIGFHFVDVKHCHGYLGHELLSAFTRKGKFGGSFENRTRFARLIIDGIKAECPGLKIGVRLSAFDFPPFNSAYPKLLPYVYGFGCDQNDPLKIDLTEPIQFINQLRDWSVRLVNVSCGSPYYTPHIQRPAMFPPSDGYQPPEDPLVGVARQIDVVRQLKAACPQSIFVGSGYSYLQEYLPRVAEGVVKKGWTDFVGVGRMVLSYWDLIADALSGKPLQAKRICRTFSDCTTAPRNGLISGCYPLDEHYKKSPQHQVLKEKKSALRVLTSPPEAP